MIFPWTIFVTGLFVIDCLLGCVVFGQKNNSFDQNCLDKRNNCHLEKFPFNVTTKQTCRISTLFGFYRYFFMPFSFRTRNWLKYLSVSITIFHRFDLFKYITYAVLLSLLISKFHQQRNVLRKYKHIDNQSPMRFSVKFYFNRTG